MVTPSDPICVAGPVQVSRLLATAAGALQRGSSRLGRLVADSPRAAGSANSQPHQQFEQAAACALRCAGSNDTVSIIAISIDNFDAVTASHGSDVASQVVSAVASRVQKIVRPDDAIIRHSDDGCVLLWAPDDAIPTATEIARRIASQFVTPVQTSTGLLPTTASIGIASATGQACSETNARTLRRQAQWSASSAQRNGRAQLTVFDHSLQDQAIESYKTERKLRAALQDDTLDVAYQPIISLHSGDVVAVEATARWEDETVGSISPETFIPIAEASGLIGQLGQLVVENAIIQSSHWNRGNQSNTLVAINLSNRQLLDPELIPTIEVLLAEHLLDPRRLCVEVSESVVMSDVATSMMLLGHMKDLGLSLAIDNFGTGYSSLSYLRQLPVDILKIDKSFVQSVYNRDDRVVTKAIIDLAHTLGMTTVAEGVENRLQVEVLHALNCDMAQGPLLHAPVTHDQVDFASFDFEDTLRSTTESLDSLSAPAATRDAFAQR